VEAQQGKAEAHNGKETIRRNNEKVVVLNCQPLGRGYVAVEPDSGGGSALSTSDKADSPSRLAPPTAMAAALGNRATDGVDLD